MNQAQNQQVTQALQANWAQTCHAILDRFTTVTKADLDAAYDADDLIHRISSKSQFDPSYVEEQVSQLVGAGAPIQQQSQQSFQAPQQQGYQSQQQLNQGQQSQGQRSSQRRNRGQKRQGWQGQRSFGSYS